MRISTLLTAILGAGVVAALATSVQAKNSPAQTASLTTPEQDVIFLREEEKLARDVYRALYKKWKLPIFDNISQAENRHMGKMGELVRRFQLNDPIDNDSLGVFTNTKLASLYEDLVALGSKSEVDALLVGATIEDLDIRDIREMMKNTTDSQTHETFAKLACGSRNHMRAFNRQLSSRGVKYKPKYLSSAEVDKILNTSQERCGQGQGKGRAGGKKGHGRRGGGQGRGHRGN